MRAWLLVGLLTFVSGHAQAAGDGTGWDTAGTTSERPALTFYKDSRPALVMTCQSTSMHVQVRNFTARQAWPQPVLTVRFGAAEQAGRPDLAQVGAQTAFSLAFPIRDKVLDALQAGLPIAAKFDGKAIDYPQPPAEMRRAFAATCAALVPAPMRAE